MTLSLKAGYEPNACASAKLRCRVDGMYSWLRSYHSLKPSLTLAPEFESLLQSVLLRPNACLRTTYIYKHIYIYKKRSKQLNLSHHKKLLQDMSGHETRLRKRSQMRFFFKRGVASLSFLPRAFPRRWGCGGGSTAARGEGRSRPPTLKRKWPPL